MNNFLDEITVADFAKKANLSVDVILDLCKKLNIRVDSDNDILFREDIKLLCDKYKDIFSNISVFFNENVSVNGNNVNVNSSFSDDIKNSASLNGGKKVILSSNNNQKDVIVNKKEEVVVNNKEQDLSSNNNEKQELKNNSNNNDFSLNNNVDESMTSESVLLDDNIDINIDSLHKGADLVNKLKNSLELLKNLLSSITVISPVDAGILDDCVSKSSNNLILIEDMITRINNIKELFPVLGDTANESFDKKEFDNQWKGTRLTAPMGRNDNGPCGSETWYDLDMTGVVHNMEKDYHYTNLEYSVREDGVKLLSGVTPDGQVFKNLVIVAADVQHDVVNKGGIFERGQIVPTSLGMGIVADFCEYANDLRKESGAVHFDIATAWWTGKYEAIGYADGVPINETEQIIPGQKEPILLEFDDENGELSINYNGEVPYV